MTSLELDPIVRDWAEVMFSIVPAEALNDCYLAAMRNPNRRPEDKKFPLKVQEILDAWYKLQAAGPGAQTSCNFCALHAYDPTEYPRCPFHSGAQQQIKKGLQL